MDTVAIVGVGLIGASFGLALRRGGYTGDIIGVSSAPAIAEARRVGAITAAASLEEACRAADLVYLSQTVDKIIETLPRVASLTKEKVLVTDAGSTKRVIVRAAEDMRPARCFVGGHPMAGKETRGASGADAGLFSGRPYVLCPPVGGVSVMLKTFRHALEQMGAYVIEATADDHDNAVAYTSHLPQLVATALAGLLAKQTNPVLAKVYGPGLLDMTRLAMSPASLWKSILQTNQQNVLSALDELLEQLANLRAAIRTDEIETEFEYGRSFVERLRRERS